MTAMLKRFLQDERGTTAIEYCIIGGFMAAAVIVGIQAFSSAWIDFTSVYTAKITAVMPP